jgi:hypothetical protein
MVKNHLLPLDRLEWPATGKKLRMLTYRQDSTNAIVHLQYASERRQVTNIKSCNMLGDAYKTLVKNLEEKVNSADDAVSGRTR